MFKILRTNNTEYPFNVQRWTKTERGFVYAGYGRFCKTLEEVKAFCRDYRNI